MAAHGDDWIEQHASDIVYIVEATRFEQTCLWEQYQKIWEEDTRGGPLVTVGEIAKFPVCIALSVIKINGYPVLIVDATSRVVDYTMIEEWLESKWPALFPKGSCNLKTNADNFHHVVHHTQRLKEVK